MTDLRLLYQLNAYDYFQEELWNALDDVRHRFDPDRIGYWTGHVFADFPGRGFRDTPGYREMNHNRLAVLQQRGHADAVSEFRSHLASEVEAGLSLS